MERVVYLLGAGFSAPLGLPVMSNFLEKSKDMYWSNRDAYPHFADVFDMIHDMSFVKNYYRTDLTNIEEILSIIEMREQVTGEEREESEFIEYLVDVIEHFTTEPKVPSGLGVMQSFGGEQWEKYSCFVASLLQLSLSMERLEIGNNLLGRSPITSPSTHYSVVTLNYDRVLELAADHIEANFSDRGLRGFDGFVRSHDQMSTGVPLAKIHGSVEDHADHSIIPPTWNKGLSKDDDRKQKIVDAWRIAYDVLRKANHIRIIGYSLPVSDSYVKYLLRSAVIEASHLKRIDVLCLDNSPDQRLEKRYAEFIDWPNFRFHSGNVLDYLELNFNMSKSTREPSGEERWSFRFDRLEEAHKDFFKSHQS